MDALLDTLKSLTGSDPLAFFAILLSGYLLLRFEATLNKLTVAIDRLAQLEQMELNAMMQSPLVRMVPRWPETGKAQQEAR